MTKHSPGPWEIHGDLTRQLYYVHGANTICDIRKPNGFHRSPAETEANARLIAAGPEMLEALKQISNSAALANEINHNGIKVPDSVWADLYQITNFVKSIIAKAESNTTE